MSNVNEEFSVEKELDLLEIDPEDDRENWPTIMIDPEEGLPNYEFVATHGTKKDGTPFGHELQIMRGVEVQVPPSIVNNLMIAVSTKYKQQPNPSGTGNVMIRSDQSSIPWRMVKAGKYFA